MSYDDHNPLLVPLRVGCVRRGLRRSRQPAGSEPPEEEAGRLADRRPPTQDAPPVAGASDGAPPDAFDQPEATTEDPWVTAEGEPWERANQPVPTSDQAAATDESAAPAGTVETAGAEETAGPEAVSGAAETAAASGAAAAGATAPSRTAGTGETGSAQEPGSRQDTAELDVAEGPARARSRLGRHSLTPVITRMVRRARDVTRRPAAAVRRVTAPLAGSGRGFTRLTLLPPLLVIAWLLPAIPLLLAGSFAVAPMLVISIPLALVLIIFGLRRVPARWPARAQAPPGLGDRATGWLVIRT